MNDDFGFSKWAVLFPVLSLVAAVVATVMIFRVPTDVAITLAERQVLCTLVAFLGLSALIQGNALFQVERRLKAIEQRMPDEEETADEDWEEEEVVSEQVTEDDEPSESDDGESVKSEDTDKA